MAFSRAMLISIVTVLAIIFSNINLSVGHHKYYVGGKNGWDFNVIQGWAMRKKFFAGDILVFKYDAGSHDVVVLERRDDFRNCIPQNILKRYGSGNDSIVLKRRYNYFICSKSNHCSAGLKMSIYAN